MIHEIRIPQMGLTSAQVMVMKWSVQDGEEVQEEDILVTIETDKVSLEISAPGSGFVKILQPKGSTVSVGDVIGLIATTRKEYNKIQPASIIAPQPELAQPANSMDSGANVKSTESSSASQSIKISGVARKMAEKYGLDLLTIQGTGPGGRITKGDVEQVLHRTDSPISDRPSEDFRPRPKEKIPFQGKKKVMAERLTNSLQAMAPMTNWEEADMTQLIEFKEKVNLKGQDPSDRLTYGDIFAKFTAQVVKEFPLFNASIEDDHVKIWEDINIGMAVAVGDDLVVPIIRNADHKSILAISRELKGLTKKAQENRLSPEDIIGGTITITNIGAFGANPGTPIITLPQVAIVGFGSITKKPVVVDDAITIRPIMLFSVTVDHRIITGAVSAKFRQRLKTLLEDPKEALLCMV